MKPMKDDDQELASLRKAFATSSQHTPEPAACGLVQITVPVGTSTAARPPAVGT